MAKPITHDDLVRKSRGITLANQRAARLEGDVENHKSWLTEISTSLALVERTAATVPALRGDVTKLRADLTEAIRGNAINPGSVDQKTIATLEERVGNLAGDLAVLTDRVDVHDVRITGLGDRLTVVERDPALQIDFDRSTNVRVEGRIEVVTAWLIAIVCGVLTGVLSGLLASEYMYEYDSGKWDWSLTKSIFVGVVIGIFFTCAVASFERLLFRGTGRITWVARPTMEEQADQLAHEGNLGHLLAPPPPPPANRTLVQPAVPRDVKV